MATYSTRREPLVSCPYNPAHQVKRGRLPIHITKCRKAYPEIDLRQCPFSVDHLVPASKLNQHIDTCPFKTTVERFLTVPAAETGGPSTGTSLPLCGATAEDAMGEENWEDDVADSPATLEEKIPAPASFPVFADVQPMAPAQRRRYYASLLPRKLDELCSDEVEPVVKHDEQHSRGIPGRTSSERLPAKQLQKPWNLVAAPGGGDSYESSGGAEGGDGGVHHVNHERGFGGAAGYGGGRSGNVESSDQLEKVQLRMKLMGLGRGRGVNRN